MALVQLYLNIISTVHDAVIIDCRKLKSKRLGWPPVTQLPQKFRENRSFSSKVESSDAQSIMIIRNSHFYIHKERKYVANATCC
jgi:hypothetical protein